MGGTRLPTESPAMWVGAPQTTSTEAGNHLHANGDEHNALSLRCRCGSACRLTAEFSGGAPRSQHAGAPALVCALARSPAAEHFMRPRPLQRFVRRQRPHVMHFLLLAAFVGRHSAAETRPRCFQWQTLQSLLSYLPLRTPPKERVAKSFGTANFARPSNMLRESATQRRTSSFDVSSREGQIL